QHVIGSTSFCGLEMAVTRHALVPRPETELLAELGWQFLATIGQTPHPACGHPLPAGRGEGRGEGYALDFGTGTGCIAVALAVKCPTAKIVATDISPDALALARENAVRHNVAER